MNSPKEEDLLTDACSKLYSILSTDLIYWTKTDTGLVMIGCFNTIKTILNEPEMENWR